MANFAELFDIRLTDCGKWSRYFTFSCHVTSSGCLCFLRHYLICACRQERVYNPRNDDVKRSLSATSSEVPPHVYATHLTSCFGAGEIRGGSLRVLVPGHGSGSQL